ncbi:MAG: methylated-DNA--[protein]-cysteine S-methyltransferase, partial [Opitutaceae bacterium]
GKLGSIDMDRLTFSTRIGVCALSWKGRLLTGFRLPEIVGGEAISEGEKGPPDSVEPGEVSEWIRELVSKIQLHLDGVPQDFSNVSLDWSAVGEFQRAVYQQTLAIRSGSTTSYGEIARRMRLGPEAARAAGVALGKNPWPLIVPCHRVVAASGKMTGFSAPGGVRTKTRLLAIEGAELSLD